MMNFNIIDDRPFLPLDIEKLLLFLSFYGSDRDRRNVADFFRNYEYYLSCDASDLNNYDSGNNRDDKNYNDRKSEEEDENVIPLFYEARKKYKLNEKVLDIEYKKIEKVLREKKIKYINVLDDRYPLKLREISAFPLVLYYRGDVSLLSHECVSVVGSRKASYDSVKMCNDLAKHLLNTKVCVVSGLAFGVDSLIHKACLNFGVKTISVLPQCVNKPIPAENLDLSRKILEKGGLLISEKSPNYRAYRSSYVERNRIISGLSAKTLIVEAEIKSGSMTTAKFALDQNREVCAMPGSISNPVAAGCNYLISQGAKIVAKAEDFYSIEAGELTRDESYDNKGKIKKDLPNSDILDFIKRNGRVEVDRVIDNSNLDDVDVIAKLTEFEVFGYIRRKGSFVEIC